LSEYESIDARLARIESLLFDLLSARTFKDFYSVAEVAEQVDRSPFQVREWLKAGRLDGVRAESGRGRHTEWRVSHAELTRYKNHGLRPGREASPR
jgi:hypothetical protein